jgi:formamidopyrimidine-DNA glycosylase
MPEMPEVETIARKLRREILGKTVSEVRLSGLSLRRPVDAAFAAVLRGRKVAAVHRRGKYLVLQLEPRAFALIHLGMSGRVFHWQGEIAPTPHTHGLIGFTDGSMLEYRDPRRFGLLSAHDGPRMRDIVEIKALGREPLSPGFDCEWLWPRLSASRREVKSFLLDQREIAGLGNIYVCEALFHAKIHPARRCHTLTQEEASRLVRAIRKVLRGAINNRGTTFSDFVASDGEPGSNQRFLRVFQRAGRKCRRCRAVIRCLRQSNRGSYYCPGCQV